MDEAIIDSERHVTRILLSYDVSGAIRRRAARVCQIVFGYEQTVHRGGTIRTYRHPGFLGRPGARWVGQSVLLLKPADAHELERELQRLGVRVRLARISIRPSEAVAFRRRS